ncbi:MAG: hypothetical protein ACR2LI_11880 [Propionibacteriaceae bacterium]
MRPHEFHDGAAAFPVFGSIAVVIMLLVVAALWYLWRQGGSCSPTSAVPARRRSRTAGRL